MTTTEAPTTQLRPSPASPAVTTRPVALPEQDHPFYSLFVQRHALRELAINADRSCQAIAPHPSTLADPDPLDTLHGEIRDTYVTLRSRRETYEHAAYMLDIAIAHVVDNLGGM